MRGQIHKKKEQHAPKGQKGTQTVKKTGKINHLFVEVATRQQLQNVRNELRTITLKMSKENLELSEVDALFVKFKDALKRRTALLIQAEAEQKENIRKSNFDKPSSHRT